MTTGKETEIVALGKTWQVGRMTLSVIEGWFDWVASRAGDPYAVAKSMISAVSREDAMLLLKQARETKQALDSMDMNSELARSYLVTPSGATRMFAGLLKQHHPNISIDEAFAILNEIGQNKSAEVIARAAGKTPEGNAQPPAV